MRTPVAIILLTTAAFAQQPPQDAALSTADATTLTRRVRDLVESTAAAVPGLARASAPLAENIRQSVTQLDLLPNHAGHTADLTGQLHAYLSLAAALPKPYPFPAEAQRQFTELRDSTDRLHAHFRALLDRKEAQIRTGDRDNLRRYAEANTLAGAPAPGRPRVVFLGDSITDGWRLNEYFPNRDFVNRGIGGQITGEMLGRFKADVIDLNPAAVIILAGTNDIARGVPLATIKNNLEMIALLAQAAKIKPLFCSVLPISDYHKATNPRFEMSKGRPPQTIRELNRWLIEFTQKRGYTYVDYYSATVDSSGMLKADLAPDGLHPNAGGYRMMAPVALQAIDALISAPAPKPTPKKRRLFGN